MNKKLKKLVSGTSVTLCALIAFSLPTQVFAQNLALKGDIADLQERSIAWQLN